MDFQIGDQVIHARYGLGQVVSLDEKTIEGQSTPCYVVQVGTLQLWVPSASSSTSTLRLPTPKKEFKKLIAILQGKAESLPDDRNERRLMLHHRVSSGKLDSVCEVVRDLVNFGRISKMNDNDKMILQRCQKLITTEWQLVFSMTETQAEENFNSILAGIP